VPYKGFLKDKQGMPTIAVGQTLDLSFSLESSYELVKDQLWTSDTGEPVEGYVLTSKGDVPRKTAAVDTRRQSPSSAISAE
jgi:hypothetical protein